MATTNSTILAKFVPSSVKPAYTMEPCRCVPLVISPSTRTKKRTNAQMMMESCTQGKSFRILERSSTASGCSIPSYNLRERLNVEAKPFWVQQNYFTDRLKWREPLRGYHLTGEYLFTLSSTKLMNTMIFLIPTITSTGSISSWIQNNTLTLLPKSENNYVETAP